ncbi:hypothetical protein ACWELJ_21295 [Nocardia sp. NPDC004582]
MLWTGKSKDRDNDHHQVITTDDPAELKTRIDQAHQRLALLRGEAGALNAAPSELELIEERDLAEELRRLERDQRRKTGQAAADAADAAREVDAEINAADRRDILAARKAQARQRRTTNPHAKLATLDTFRTWSLRALGGVVVGGMVWSAINVQYNVVHHDPANQLTASDMLFWVSYILEAMVSVCLVVLMVGVPKLAEWDVKLTKRTVLVSEGALLLIMLGLNTFPYLRDWQPYDIAIHALAPGMVAIAMRIYHAMSDKYAEAIDRASKAIPADADPLAEYRAKVAPYLAPADATSHSLPEFAPAGAPLAPTSHLALRTASTDATPALAPAAAPLAPAEQMDLAPTAATSDATSSLASAPAPLAPADDALPSEMPVDLAPLRTEPDQPESGRTADLAAASANLDATTGLPAALVAEYALIQAARRRGGHPVPIAPATASPAPPQIAPALAPTSSSASPASHQPVTSHQEESALAGARPPAPTPPPSATLSAATGSVVRALPEPRTDADGPDQCEVRASRILAAGLVTKPTMEQIATVLRMLDEGSSDNAIKKATATRNYGGIHHKTVKAIAAADQQLKTPVRIVK